MNILENNLDKVIKHINNNSLGFAMKNHPNRNHEGIYLSGEPFDYTIIKKSTIYCFDAKETIKDKWIIKDKDLKQAINLYKISKLSKNYQCFFLIYFKTENEIKFIDIDSFEKIIQERKHIKIEDCNKFDIKELIK